MADLPPTVVTEPLQAKKPRKRGLWLLVLVPFGCAGLCAITALAWVVLDPSLMNVFRTGAPQVKIEAGTYDGAIYTAPNDNFTCNFETIMVSGLNPVLHAVQNVEKGTGTVFALNDFGTEYGVDYFEIAQWGGDELSSALSDPVTKPERLQLMLENVLLPARGLNAEITHDEMVTDDILFAVITNPEASYLVKESNGVTTQLGFEEGYYIFAGEEWFYFTYFFLTPINASQQMSPSDMQRNVEKFYQGCHFSS